MNRKKRAQSRGSWLGLLVVILVFASTAWGGATEKVLYSFQGGTDGMYPTGNVIFDQAGNLYGTTPQGGGTNYNCIGDSCGTVFELTPQDGVWTETVLYAFTGKSQNDGDLPNGGLVSDQDGNLYGVTGYGGAGDCRLSGSLVGCGTVYELTPPAGQGDSWTETIVYSFQGGKDGYLPLGNLTFDAKGNLYGATFFGGGHGTCDQGVYPYCGTVFELSPPSKKGGDWTEKVLYSFKNGPDGTNPNGGLIFDGEGALYGTTVYGGAKVESCADDGGDGCGVAFELKPPARKGGAWVETVLHRFTDFPDGRHPFAGVVFGSEGNLYGTTLGGGQGSTADGTVFELKPRHGGGAPWSETVLYTFLDGNDGGFPMDPLILDNKGNLYGEAGAGAGGTIFEMSPPTRRGGAWTYVVLYNFTDSPDGDGPEGGLIFDGAGNLYGTTHYGGTGEGCEYGGCGTVFEVTP